MAWVERSSGRGTGLLAVPVLLLASGPAGAQLPPPYASDSAILVPRPMGEGTLTTVNGLAFSPDGCTLYVSRRVEEQDASGRPRVRIFRHRCREGGWSGPEPVSFSSSFTDYQPVLSPDGSRLYFTSTRPLEAGSDESRQNIWYVERDSTEWGTPRPVAELATPGWDGYAVPTRSGRLYFVSERPGGRGAVDIWVTEVTPVGTFGEPHNVAVLNSEHGDSDLFVDPDERYIIFHRSVDATESVQFWIAFGAGGAWRAPRLLDEINGPGWELSPTVSPDGRYFFFQRDGVILQIDFCALVRTDERIFLFHPRLSAYPCPPRATGSPEERLPD
jgi:Tol biopolymer transport system component